MTTLRALPSLGAIVSGAFNLMSLGARGLGVAIMSIPIIGWIAAVIAGLIALGAYLWNTSAEFRGVLTGVWEFIKTAFTGYYKFIYEVMQAIWHVIKGVFDPRNWFDKNYHFSDAIGKVVDAAKEYGQSMGKAFSEGREKGMESFYAAHPEKRPGAIAEQNGAKSTDLGKKTASPLITPKPLASLGKSDLSGSGSGSGVKNITQNIEIKNYFTTSGSNTEIEMIAEKIVRALNGKLRDGTTIAFG
jgi:hypothetical protein